MVAKWGLVDSRSRNLCIFNLRVDTRHLSLVAPLVRGGFVGQSFGFKVDLTGTYSYCLAISFRTHVTTLVTLLRLYFG